MTGAVPRLGLLLAAAAAVAWLALGLRSASLEASGAAVATGPASGLTPARVSRALDELERADDALPRRDPAVLRARLLERTGRRPQALAILRRLVAEEPENSRYWIAVARTARRADPALAARARARLRELSPIATPG